ncbi:ubiquitin-related domain-containing protein [Umbelopsis sp. PMI_123]|nr:ubiquitin-related domain-containing protein [Umbelopsis sp. PMI_123]
MKAPHDCPGWLLPKGSSSNQLNIMAALISDEPEFIAQYLNTLSSRSVRYGLDHTPFPPSPKKLKRTPPTKSHVTPVEKPAVSEEQPTSRLSIESTTESVASTIKVTVKTLKPASQFEIFNLKLTDTIATLKDRISQQRSIPMKQQRLLIKGKVLNDTKPLAEYAITDGTVIHLMIRSSTTTSEPKSEHIPVAPTPTAESASQPEVGAHGITKSAEDLLKQPEIWKKLNNVLKEQLSEEDARTILSRFLQSESWSGVSYEQIQ